jgi:PAS domain S-box-containing protein
MPGARHSAALKEREREIERLKRLCAALRHVSHAIVWTPNRNDLFQRICRILVEDGGFKMAWIGWHDAATQRLVPVAEYGDETRHLQTITVYAADRPEGLYPSGIAFRTGRPFMCKDLAEAPATVFWRTELMNLGFRACAAFPIRLKDTVVGTLSVSSNEVWCSHDGELALLAEAASDISFALANFARDEEQARAEALARNEREFSATMIESMPGAFYFFDQRGRFLRWNRNLEVISGYESNEVAEMHPLNFFPPEEHALVEQRIRSTFERGESTVEASILAKNGKVTPYFLTGRRVLFNGALCLMGVGIDISERKAAEQALRESERKLRAIFEQAPLGIAVLNSNSGRFLKLNPQYCRISGYSETEMLASDFQRITHPDDVQRDLANMQRLREGRLAAFQMEKRYIRPDASVVWVNLTCVPLWDEAGGELQHIAMVDDITARKEAQLRLAESEHKYRELVELANSIILRWNCDGKITFLNEFGQQFFGYSAQEILGRHVVGTIVPARSSAGADLRKLMDQICATPAAFEKNVNENMCRNGDRVWIAWTNRILMDAQGRVVEILSVGADITEQRRAELALRVLNKTLELEVAERTSELQTALIRAESADRTKSAFLAAMSHELRTPLNSIIGFTGIMLQGLAGPLNAEQTKQLGMVQSSARHLLALINDVLDLSKIEAGQLDVRAEPFDLRSSIERVTASVNPLVQKKGLALHTEIAAEVGEIVSDRRRVEQILLNLLSNAIKFTDHGRVTLTAERVMGVCRSPGGPDLPAVRLRVIDTGIGMKPEHLSTLFQPFRQIDTGLARQHEGTGLGLAICRRLATLMGGDISAASEWAKGSEFTLNLPLRNPSKA